MRRPSPLPRLKARFFSPLTVEMDDEALCRIIDEMLEGEYAGARASRFPASYAARWRRKLPSHGTPRSIHVVPLSHMLSKRLRLWSVKVTSSATGDAVVLVSRGDGARLPASTAGSRNSDCEYTGCQLSANHTLKRR